MFHGSMVAIVTPMQSNGEVDYDSFSKLLDWHVESGTKAVIVLGTTGESATIDQKERRKLIRLASEQLKGRMPVIAGTGANSTAIAIEYTKWAMQDGADAALLVTPYYNKPPQEGLYQHYKVVANKVPIPLILYNVPGRTGCDLLPETAIRLAPIPNIIGFKEATGNIDRVKTILDGAEGKLDLFSGDDPSAFDFLKAGGKGVISVTANVAPVLMGDMCTKALEGDFDKAEELQKQLMPLHKSLFIESNPIPTKWALNQMGKIPDGIRLPLTQLANECHDVVRNALKQVGIL